MAFCPLTCLLSFISSILMFYNFLFNLCRGDMYSIHWVGYSVYHWHALVYIFEATFSACASVTIYYGMVEVFGVSLCLGSQIGMAL